MKNNKLNIHKRSGFTFIEILIVIAIVAVLAVGVIFFLSPAQLQSQARDTNRVSDLTTLNQDIALYHETQPGGFLGTSSVVYVSIPDPTATSTAGTNCAGIGLVSTSTTYHCASPSTYKLTNGTGWIPVNFAAGSNASLLATLPVDPVNNTSTNEYYVYVTNGNQYEVLANPEAAKTIANSTTSFIQGNNIALLPTFPGATSTATSTGGGSSTQHLWIVTDTSNNTGTSETIQKFDLSLNKISTFGGGEGSGNGQFIFPYGVAIDGAGNAYVTDPYTNRVQKFDSNGNYVSQFGTVGSGNGQLSLPAGIAIDGNGNIWVVDKGNDRVEEFSSSGGYLSQFGSIGTSTGKFKYPQGIAIDSSGNIFVTDISNENVQKFSSSGTYISSFGSAGSGNGQFSSVYGIAIDASGNIWVTDANNQRIQKFNSSGVYVTQVGTYGTGTSQFHFPYGIAVDASGNVWVSDGYQNVIQEFDTNANYITEINTLGGITGGSNGVAGLVIK